MKKDQQQPNEHYLKVLFEQPQQQQRKKYERVFSLLYL